MRWTRLGVVACSALALVAAAAACGESSNTAGSGTTATETSTTSTSTSVAVPTTAPVTTAVPTTTSVPPALSPPLRACQAGEGPAISAYDRESGSTVWSVCQDASQWRELIGANESAVYLLQASSSSGGPTNMGWFNLVAIDATTGAERWRTTMGGFTPFVLVGPVSGQGVVVTTLDDQAGHAIAGVDSGNGEVRWRFPATTDMQALATSEDVVVVRGPIAALTGLDRASGKQLWSVQQNAVDAIADEDVVVVTAPHAPPVGLDIRSGAQLWQAGTAPGGIAGGAAGGVVAWGGQDDPTSALDTASGEWLWSEQAGHAAYDNVWAVGDGAVFVVDEGRTLAYDLRTGKIRWRGRAEAGPADEPWLVAGQDLFSVGGELTARSTTDGATRWVVPTPNERLHIQGVAVGTGTVFASFGEQMGD